MKTPIKYLINPCDIDRLKVLAPLGDALAWVWDKFVGNTECSCCLGTRLVLALAAAYVAGTLL